ALSRLCGVAAAFMILASVLITCQMIWIRFVLGGSTIWQTEVVIYLMVGATLIGLPYVQLLRGHVSVDALSGILPPALRRGLSCLTLGLAVGVIALMAFYGFEMFEVAWRRNWKSDTVWGPPLWIPYLALPIGFGLYLLQLCVDLWTVAAVGERR
ncbi:MAG: C4-dicarboxylate ABC transporter substrate-binding protein, partial [Alphaproteobacteria bacterium HGW-Alphaproteobacteria-8]